jgi:hypothetical protein
VDVFFEGVRQFERVLKPEYAGMNEEDLWLEVGPEATISGWCIRGLLQN